jgi:hypothetical protein
LCNNDMTHLQENGPNWKAKECGEGSPGPRLQSIRHRLLGLSLPIQFCPVFEGTILRRTVVF